VHGRDPSGGERVVRAQQRSEPIGGQVLGAGDEQAGYRKTMLTGLPVFTTWPVGVSLPLA
jgi:hypothetical protein